MFNELAASDSSEKSSRRKKPLLQSIEAATDDTQHAYVVSQCELEQVLLSGSGEHRFSLSISYGANSISKLIKRTVNMPGMSWAFSRHANYKLAADGTYQLFSFLW